jgi:hypothetical protein
MFVSFNIPRQEIALKKETTTIEKEKSAERNEKIVSGTDLLAMKQDTDGETTIGVEFWTAAVVMLSLAIVHKYSGSLCCYLSYGKTNYFSGFITENLSACGNC